MGSQCAARCFHPLDLLGLLQRARLRWLTWTPSAAPPLTGRPLLKRLRAQCPADLSCSQELFQMRPAGQTVMRESPRNTRKLSCANACATPANTPRELHLLQWRQQPLREYSLAMDSEICTRQLTIQAAG